MAFRVNENLPLLTLASPPTACIDAPSAAPPSLAVMAMLPPALWTVCARETVAPPAVTASTNKRPLAPSALMTEPDCRSTAVPAVDCAADEMLTLPPANTLPRASDPSDVCSPTAPATSSCACAPRRNVPCTGIVDWKPETIARLMFPPGAEIRPSAIRFRPARRLTVASGSTRMALPDSRVRSPAAAVPNAALAVRVRFTGLRLGADS